MEEAAAVVAVAALHLGVLDPPMGFGELLLELEALGGPVGLLALGRAARRLQLALEVLRRLRGRGEGVGEGWSEGDGGEGAGGGGRRAWMRAARSAAALIIFV